MKPPRQRRPAAARAQGSAASRWLVVIDNEPIRKRILAAYHKTERAMSQAREALEHFESTDLPAFHRWEAATFGSLLSEVRELTAALEPKQQILAAVQEEMYWSGCSRVAAYRRVMNPPPPEEPEAGEKSPPPDHEDDDVDGDPFDDEPKLFGDSDLPPDFDIHEFDAMSTREQNQFRNFFEGVARMFTMMTDIEAPDLDVLLEEARAKASGTGRGPGQDRPTATDRKTSRIKELYRMLVRQLHPDHKGGAQTSRERELWDQVQSAYQSGNLASLEALAGRVEIGTGNAGSLPIQIIQRMVRDLKTSLQGLQRQIKGAQQHHAWNFATKPVKIFKLEARIRRDLKDKLDFLRWDLARAERELADLEARANKPKAKPKAKPKPTKAKTPPQKPPRQVKENAGASYPFAQQQELFG